MNLHIFFLGFQMIWRAPYRNIIFGVKFCTEVPKTASEQFSYIKNRLTTNFASQFISISTEFNFQLKNYQNRTTTVPVTLPRLTKIEFLKYCNKSVSWPTMEILYQFCDNFFVITNKKNHNQIKLAKPNRTTFMEVVVRLGLN